MLDLAALVRLFCHPAPLRTLEAPFVTPIGVWTW